MKSLQQQLAAAGLVKPTPTEIETYALKNPDFEKVLDTNPNTKLTYRALSTMFTRKFALPYLEKMLGVNNEDELMRIPAAERLRALKILVLDDWPEA